LLRPSTKRSDFGCTLGTIVDIAIHLRDRFDHPQVAVRDDSGNHASGVFIRVDDERPNVRVSFAQRNTDGIRRRDVSDTDACRKKENAD
jgi:hypothetical protein